MFCGPQEPCNIEGSMEKHISKTQEQEKVEKWYIKTVVDDDDLHA